MEKKCDNVLLFTGTYPYSVPGESPFIDPELPYLNSVFHSITIIPKTLEEPIGNPPEYVRVETTLGHMLKPKPFIQSTIQNALLCLSSLFFFKELVIKRNKILHLKSILTLIHFLGVALKTKKWVLRYIDDEKIDLEKTIFYTYWLNDITFGIYLAKIKNPKIKVISRVHGLDLYEERHSPAYIPFRPEIFSALNKVFADSEAGKEYLSTRYPEYNLTFHLSRLGVPNPKFITQSSNDGIFRIVSCSYLVSVKRIDLLIEGLAELGDKYKNNNFEWTHIGEGPLRLDLERAANFRLPRNVKCSFYGFLPQGGVISYYRNHNVDVFVNVSSSEGTPVSIMEAQSCSIPVIATAVGGNSEIVSNENGLLLSKNPSPTEIANTIYKLLNDPNILNGRKMKSYQTWFDKYNSEKNFRLFVQELIKEIENK
jgi:glycosyltransferase involved in cell wall biosynthesis